MSTLIRLAGTSFSLRSSSIWRAALVALLTLAPASAAFNAPNPGNSPTLPSYVDFDDNNCQSVGGGLGGYTTNNGLNLSLNGSASLTGYGSAGSCYMAMYWQGTASGSILPNAQIGANIIFSVPYDVNFTCTLYVYANNTLAGSYNCVPTQLPAAPDLAAAVSQPAIGFQNQSFNLSAQAITLPANTTTYSIRLVVNASWTDTAHTLFTVNVPGATSIDLTTTAGAATAPVGTPALSPFALGGTGLMLILLAGYATLRHEPFGGRFPGNRG